MIGFDADFLHETMTEAEFATLDDSADALYEAQTEIRHLKETIAALRQELEAKQTGDSKGAAAD